MEKKNDGVLIAALLIIIFLIVITICGCETAGGFGRDITYLFDGYKMARMQNQQPADN